MGIREDAINLIKEKKVSQIGMRKFLAGKEIVCLIKKPGRNILTCSCENHARFCNESPICKHKLACMFFWVIRGTDERL